MTKNFDPSPAELIAEAHKFANEAGLPVSHVLRRVTNAFEAKTARSVASPFPDRAAFVKIMADVAESYSIHDGDERRYSERVYDAIFGELTNAFKA